MVQTHGSHGRFSIWTLRAWSNSSEGGLEAKLDALLRVYEDIWGNDWHDLPLGPRFQRLLSIAHEKSGHRCVVLVDEYDKPLLETMDNPSLEEHNRTVLKGFYSVLKGADEHLRFAFLTGVTKFSKVSIFSDLNQLSDISLSEDYASVCGITEEELLGVFDPELDAFAARRSLSKQECLESLRSQYDGYCFHPDGPEGEGRKVYNPFSLLKALKERRLGSYWFETGTPTFLVKRIRSAGLDPQRLVNGSIYATERRLSDYRADDPDPVPLLFQSGYLTIAGYDDRSSRYTLAVPNGEVEWGLMESLLADWTPGYGEARGTDVFTLWDLVEAGDTDGMRRVLASLFASIPYTQETDPFEHYFQAVIWLTFTLLGRYVSVEQHQNNGRVDRVIEARTHVYVMEFKRDGTAAEALAQIEDHGYAEPFAADSRTLHCIGCAFDSKTRRLSDWEER